MKPFRKHAALAVDGGGIRGTMVAKAMAVLEEAEGKPCHEMFGLTAGTSTGSIIAGALAAGIRAEKIHELYITLGKKVFRKSWRTIPPFKFIVSYQYPTKRFISYLRKVVGETTMGELWDREPRVDVVITTRDVVGNRTLFIKPWKDKYKKWKVWKAVLCSSSAPTYMPVVDGRYVDGGVGSYANPCYIAAFEAAICLEDWLPEETTLISLGTGRYKKDREPGWADGFNALDWAPHIIDTFMADASEQQVALVQRFFAKLDFRRFEVDLPYPIEMDDAKAIPVLTKLGEKLGEMILNDEMDNQNVARDRKPDTVRFGP